MNKTILSNAIFMTFFLSTVSHGYTQNEASFPIRALEGDNCNRVVELIYQSEKLASNDSSTKVYFEGFLRRIGKDEDQTDTGYFTYDLKSDKLSYIEACQEEDWVEYRGFISSLEIAFKCSSYGQDPTETSFIYDIFNSSNGQVYRVRERIRIKHERFGEIVDEMSIIKRQVF